jgi:hypothetical protein
MNEFAFTFVTNKEEISYKLVKINKIFELTIYIIAL